MLDVQHTTLYIVSREHYTMYSNETRVVYGYRCNNMIYIKSCKTNRTDIQNDDDIIQDVVNTADCIFHASNNRDDRCRSFMPAGQSTI